MNQSLYFAYGSNLDDDQMRGRCPGSKVEGIAHLAGYALVFGGKSSLWGGPVATLVREAGARTDGVLYSVTERDLAALDRYEGHPRFYRRESLEVTDREGRTRSAWVYLMPEQGLVRGAPSGRYLGVIRAAYAKHGFEVGALERGR